MKKYLLFSLLICLFTNVNAQSSAFGIKGGFTAAFQKWNNFQRDPLLTWHIISYIESAPEDNKVALFAQAGYHNRGSAIVIRPYNYTNVLTMMPERFPGSTEKYQFRNISLSLGAKQKKEISTNKYLYYMLGIRGDYTIGTNLNEFEIHNTNNNTLYYPTDNFVRKFNYGLIVGGGIEFHFTELVGGLIELTINPDVSKQYEQFPINNVYDPYLQTNTTLPGRDIRNMTIELSVGCRFLRKVEYID